MVYVREMKSNVATDEQGTVEPNNLKPCKQT